ncbi:sensor histidine kinase [Paenibacillus pinihumi]|uniref:sensor histidine kinase n=1 Tax=Paenibacillus pinihumi TaxID=669462 RepID=UPI0004239B13|nr:HAMP domain-containing sensor histidine kinase [Paenibacillus pinihumi]
MIRDRIIMLIFFQILLLTGTIMASLLQPSGAGFPGQHLLLAAAIGIGLALLGQQLRYRSKMKEICTALIRAVQGNVNTRILAKEDRLLNDVIFKINELIEQLSKLQVRTVRSEAARKSLLANISHDIRTPLTSIIGYVDAIKDDLGGTRDRHQQYVEIVAEKSAVLKALIDNIFQLAKLDADEMPITTERLDLAEITREAVILFMAKLAQYGMKLDAEIPDAPCYVDADSISTQRILANLIQNAIQHGSSGGVLGIRMSSSGGSWNVEIWDCGTGISSADLEHIFDRMYRSDGSRKQWNGGSGLGLAIAKGLADKNGGHLTVASDPGRLTVFTLSLPAAELRNS